MSKWNDTTSYRKGETDATPRAWTIHFADRFSVIVHRHIHYPPNAWLVSCHELQIDNKPLRNDKVEKAKAEAVAFIESHLSTMLDAVRKFIEETT